jgi:hypothetical protein
MQNTFRKIQNTMLILGLSLGLLLSSFASQAIILEYDYEVVDASNNEYLFNFNISDLSSYSESYFEFSIWFDNIAGDLQLEDADIIDFGPSVALNTSIYPADPVDPITYPAIPVGETSVSEIFFEFFPYDNILSEPTLVSLFSTDLVNFSTMVDDAITGISVLLKTNGILPNDLVVNLEGFAEDANFNVSDITPITGTDITVNQPPTGIPSPSIAALFVFGLLMLKLSRKNKK